MADERKAVHKRVEYSDKASICADCFHNAVCGGYESKGVVWCEGYANAADVRPVVTCEACVWHIDDGTHYCNKWCEPCPDNAEFFCAYGERDNRGADMREVDDG